MENQEVKIEMIDITDEGSNTMEFMPLESPLITQKYTKVFYEYNYKGTAPSCFMVIDANVDPINSDEILAMIDFQNGPVSEGINGAMGEDLIAMVIKRLECFQQTKFACKENEQAIVKLEEALMWLRKRTTNREMKNIEGTHEV